MRVIAGSAKGRPLLALEGEEVTRPTADRVKEAVFGRIQFELADSRVLDLFAGSGALGIEALSRGARSAVFVEKNRAAAQVVRKNLENTGLAGRGRLLEMDYLDALERLEGPFDFIFMDPPYRSGYYEPALCRIRERNLLSSGGMVIAEHDGTQNFAGMALVKSKKYGKTYIACLAEERAE